ncbi:hypothetical protein LPB137_08295 [Poseidonibacter parvus]|uniref:Uncharacterized protein n=1 Tax=Poseidonibacter parvus TaxID=1850254 RepID=A0A1P8KMS5_9BACT|nr:hypothetical protein [Poseidonibacter parvus]APW65856.1 hypothetical protein LPB137_08295 [Poseidonibacter parvus]
MNRLFLHKTKTIALLVYIRSTIEQLFLLIKKKEYASNLLTGKDSQIILDNLTQLLIRLKKSEIMNEKDFRNNIYKSNVFNPYYEELVQYYNSIVLEIENNMQSGDLWIPDQFILSLLSEWVLEEKHTQYFPYLLDINYIELLSKFEKVNLEENKKYREKVSQMYMISTKVIKRLKNKEYQPSVIKSRKKR